MDRSRALSRFLGALPLLLLLGAGSDGLPVREARWLAPGALYRGLTREPGECFAPPQGRGERRKAEIGRIAFRTPLLLGGQAARAGLSCSSCHRNGRGNPDFLFPGLSGDPGTADVTASLMSSHRGDGRFNPKPIPDLGGPREKLKISQEPGSRALETFIHGLIAEEFDGPEPPQAVLGGLAAYVRSLRPEACPKGEHRIDLDSRLDLIEEAVELSSGDDGETRRLLLAAARSQLGAIDERFAVSGGEGARALLREADRRLRALRDGDGDMAGWRREWPGLRRRLIRLESRSLFSPARLRSALRRS